MGDSPTVISSLELCHLVGTSSCPLVFDVRRGEVFAQAEEFIPTAKWRDHRNTDAWGNQIPGGSDVVVYCVHGHQVSRSATALLRSLGVRARYLAGGIEGYRATGGPLVRKDAFPDRAEDGPSRWVTRERPKIARIACPWFIRR